TGAAEIAHKLDSCGLAQFLDDRMGRKSAVRHQFLPHSRGQGRAPARASTPCVIGSLYVGPQMAARTIRLPERGLIMLRLWSIRPRQGCGSILAGLAEPDVCGLPL